MTSLDFDVVARDHASAALIKVARSMQASESAADKVSSAMRRQADAAGQVRVAQTRLDELQKRGKASASQLAAAEERVARAQRGAEAANRTLGRAQKALATSQQQVVSKTDVQSKSFQRNESAMHRSERTGRALRSTMLRLTGVFAGLAVVSKVGSFLKDANAEARESQKVGAQTAAVLRSTGHAANVTSGQIGRLATAISNKTGIDDEQIQAGENMLATFTNIRNRVGKNNDIFNKATQAATDLGVALKMDTAKAALQVGKALNDPEKGLTRLQRVGVTFTEQQKKQVAQMVKVGDTAGAQRLILRELSKEFGGSAAAQATAGDKLKTTWANFKEQIGTQLLPTIDKIAGGIATKAIPALSNFATGIGGVISILAKGDFAGAAKTFGFEEDSGQVAFLFRLRDAFIAVAKMVKSTTVFGDGFRSFLVDKLWPALQQAYQTIMPGVQQAMAIIGKAFGGAGTKGQTFSSVVSRIGEVITTKVIPAIATFTRYYLPYIATQVAIVIAALRLGWGAFVRLNLIVTRVGADVIRTVLTMFGTIIHGAAAAFGWLDPTGKLKAAAAAFDRFEGEARDALQGIENGAYDLAHGSEQYGTQWAAGLAAGIRKNAHVPVAEAQGVANKVAAITRQEMQTASPSKVAARLGGYWSQGIGVGIRGKSKDATGAAKQVADRVIAYLDAAIKRTTDRLSSARSKLGELKSAFADIQKSVADTVRGGLDLSSFTNPTSLAGGFSAFAAKVRSFAYAIRRMISERYPSSLVQQVAAMGVDGLATARAFADADLSQRRAIIRDYTTTARLATSLGGSVARSTSLDERIRLQQAQIRRLDRTNDYLRRLYLQAKKDTVVKVDGHELLRIQKKAERTEARSRRSR